MFTLAGLLGTSGQWGFVWPVAACTLMTTQAAALQTVDAHQTQRPFSHASLFHTVAVETICLLSLQIRELGRNDRPKVTAVFYLTQSHFSFSGDNILAVLRYLLTSEKLADSSQYRHGNMVFFDLLGVFVVAYPARVGTILNYVVAVATFLYLARKASQPGASGGSPPPPIPPFPFAAFPTVLSVYVAFSVLPPSQAAAMCESWPAPRAWRS